MLCLGFMLAISIICLMATRPRLLGRSRQSRRSGIEFEHTSRPIPESLAPAEDMREPSRAIRLLENIVRRSVNLRCFSSTSTATSK